MQVLTKDCIKESLNYAWAQNGHDHMIISITSQTLLFAMYFGDKSD